MLAKRVTVMSPLSGSQYVVGAVDGNEYGLEGISVSCLCSGEFGVVTHLSSVKMPSLGICFQ